MIFVSPGALRNWCKTAGVSARRFLILARLLRAVALGAHGRHRPENLLDVTDLRTLRGLLKTVGLGEDFHFGVSVHELLDWQRIVTDPDTLDDYERQLSGVSRTDQPDPGLPRNTINSARRPE